MSVASFYSLQFDDASASIRVSKHRMIQAGNDMRETALMTRQVILRSRAAMAEADRLLTRPWEKENVGGRAQKWGSPRDCLPLKSTGLASNRQLRTTLSQTRSFARKFVDTRNLSCAQCSLNQGATHENPV